MNEVPTSIVDYLELYLLNYFKPGTHDITHDSEHGRRLMADSGCPSCHVADLRVERDRRLGDVETAHDPENGILDSLFATAATPYDTVDEPRVATPSGIEGGDGARSLGLERVDGRTLAERILDGARPVAQAVATPAHVAAGRAGAGVRPNTMRP